MFVFININFNFAGMKGVNPYAFVGMNYYKSDAQNIINTVINVLQIDKETLLSRTRKREVVEARQIAMHIIRERCIELSLSKIGSLVGGKDHATVLHACKVVNNLLETDKHFKSKYNSVLRNMSSVSDSTKSMATDTDTIGELYNQYLKLNTKIK